MPARSVNRFLTLTILESSLEGEAVLNVTAALEERIAEQNKLRVRGLWRGITVLVFLHAHALAKSLRNDLPP